MSMSDRIRVHRRESLCPHYQKIIKRTEEETGNNRQSAMDARDNDLYQVSLMESHDRIEFYPELAVELHDCEKSVIYKQIMILPEKS